MNNFVLRFKTKMIFISFIAFVFIQNVQSISIGIVGGGVGGTSAAYFLREVFKDHANIDLYEQAHIGGRLATVMIDEDEYETGGTIIHDRNKYVKQLMKTMNLTKLQTRGVVLGLFGDKGFEFVGSKYSYMNSLRMLWKYGFGLIKLDNSIASLLDIFERIYELQDRSNSYRDLTDLLGAMDRKFLHYLKITAYDGFKQDGFSDKIINELIFATLRCNYGQSTRVNKFVGSVSVAGAGAELFSIKGGNKQLPENLFKLSRANLIKAKVVKVRKDIEGQYGIVSTNGNKKYDTVIIATPLTSDHKNHIELELDSPIEIPGRYHRTVCTIVKGVVNHEFFGYNRSSDVPDVILTVSENLFFNSFSKTYPVNGKNNFKKQVWKIFSQEILTDHELKNLFNYYIVIDTIDWLAYPHYNTDERKDTFVLGSNIYYINAIEWSASAIEMSIIGARNVALLAHKHYQQSLSQKRGNNKSREEL